MENELNPSFAGYDLEQIALLSVSADFFTYNLSIIIFVLPISLLL